MRRIVLAALLVLAACGGGDDDSEEEAPRDTTTTVVDSDGDPETSTTVAGSSGDDSAATTSVAAGESPPTTTILGGTDAVPAQASEAPQPIAPGTYRYRQTGRTTAGPQTYDAPPEGKAVIDPPSAEGTQAAHRYIDPEGQPADAYFLFAPDGIFLYETVITMGPTTINCVFEPALATPAWPPTVGGTSSASADCGSFTTNVTTKITGRTPVSIDGASYEAYVIETVITTEGDVVMTSRQVDHFVAELRLSTHTETESDGTYQGFDFASSGTSDLVSAIPE
jgi:hypothetical protein